MTVKELREHLEELDDNTEIVTDDGVGNKDILSITGTFYDSSAGKYIIY